MYVVDRIVGQDIVDGVCKYRIRLYGHAATDDAYAPELKIPERSVTRYWTRHKRSQGLPKWKINDIVYSVFKNKNKLEFKEEE